MTHDNPASCHRCSRPTVRGYDDARLCFNCGELPPLRTTEEIEQLRYEAQLFSRRRRRAKEVANHQQNTPNPPHNRRIQS